MSSGSALNEVHNTAFQSAALRAGHFLTGAEPKIFRDEFAARLIEMTEDEAIAFTAKVPPASASTVIVRARFTEDRLAAARNRLNQYVVLGAGLDSYALRMGETLGSLIVYEVDDPPFQAWKRQRIETLGLKTPKQVRYAPCDFETMSIDQALAAQGFAANEPCFISWLGVTQYLTRDAIRQTLRWAAQRPKGSEISFTYVENNTSEQKRSAKPGVVPYLSYFTTDEITQLLRELGFSRIEHLTRAEAEETYFKNRSDGMTAPISQRDVAAIV
jgi:methyltransferase (TIGR00027 family)